MLQSDDHRSDWTMDPSFPGTLPELPIFLTPTRYRSLFLSMIASFLSLGVPVCSKAISSTSCLWTKGLPSLKGLPVFESNKWTVFSSVWSLKIYILLQIIFLKDLYWPDCHTITADTDSLSAQSIRPHARPLWTAEETSFITVNIDGSALHNQELSTGLPYERYTSLLQIKYGGCVPIPDELELPLYPWFPHQTKFYHCSQLNQNITWLTAVAFLYLVV